MAEDRIFPTFKEVCQIGLTFTFVLFGWIIFRANTIGVAFEYIKRIFNLSLLSIPYEPLLLIKLMAFCTTLAVMEWIQRKKNHGLEINVKSPVVRFVIYAVMIFITIAGSGNPATFIYFQF